MKHMNAMTIEDFKALPLKNEPPPCRVFDSVILLPAGDINPDHGYQDMEFILVVGREVTCRIRAWDTISLGSIMDSIEAVLVGDVPIANEWAFDCLATSGLIRLFCKHKRLSWSVLGHSLIAKKENP